ncbi:hypothetical protein BDV19DRAFT_50687 [Aspergillus venezuelensis]
MECRQRTEGRGRGRVNWGAVRSWRISKWSGGGCWSGFAGGLGHCFLPPADWPPAGILLSPKPQRQIQVHLDCIRQSSHLSPSRPLLHSPVQVITQESSESSH